MVLYDFAVSINNRIYASIYFCDGYTRSAKKIESIERLTDLELSRVCNDHLAKDCSGAVPLAFNVLNNVCAL